jgi:phospholipid/cholesterol/gamma-HCH transport system substrate-binding protein
MKISNETKVGALAAIAITLLILGFNFLKGRNLFSNSSRIYAKFDNVDGLAPSNAVMVNGLQIGTVYEIKPADKAIDTILVTLNMTKDVNIPVNSVAFIRTPPLGTPEIDITLGNSGTHLKLGDTILTKTTGGLLDGVMKSVDPVLTQVSLVLHSLDSVLDKFSSILDPNTKGNLRNLIANLNKTAENLTVSTEGLNQLLNKETGSVSKTMEHLNSFTDNLAKNNETLTATLQNLKKTSDGLAAGNIEHTLKELDSTSASLHQVLGTTTGSVGALLNEKTLYNNLNSTIRSLNILLDDLKVHPKRYVSISVFGKKDKSTPLKAPLSEDTLHNTTNH